MEKLEPGRGDVESRLAELARQGRTTPSVLPAPTPLPTPLPRPSLELGMEEVGSDTLSRLEAERIRRTLLRAREEASRGEGALDANPGDEEREVSFEPVETGEPVARAPEPIEEAEDEGAPDSEASPAPPGEGSRAPTAEPPGEPASGVAGRLRGVFRRLLAGLPAAGPPASEEVSPPAGAENPSPVSADATPAAEHTPPAPEPPPEEAAPEPPVRADESLPSLGIEAGEPTPVPSSPTEEAELPSLELSEETEEDRGAALPAQPEELPEVTTFVEPGAAEALAAEPLAAEADVEAGGPTEDESDAEAVALAHSTDGAPDGETAVLTPTIGPLPGEPSAPPPDEATAQPSPPRVKRPADLDAFLSISDDVFQDQVADLLEDMLVPGGEPDAASLDALPGLAPAPARPLLTGPLFDGLSDEERVALVRGLQLRTFEPGDVILAEGETGSSLFLLTAGAVKVFVRNPAGHNLLLDSLGEGDFFGEISTFSGRPRSATVTAAAPCEILELDQVSLTEIAVRHPHLAERLESLSRERAGSPEAAALRGGGAEPPEPSLESHFDDGRWEPRLRLRLADAFLKAGQEREASQVLIDLADELVRRGQNEKAVALLKKVEQLHRRPRGPRPAVPPEKPARGGGSDDRLRDWLIDVVRDTVRRRQAVATRGLDTPPAEAVDPETLRAYGRGLVASPLFEGLAEDDLLALVRGLALRLYEPGDVVLTEGELGESVLIVATGRVKVFIRNRAGREVLLRELGEGAFFGEISALSGRSRTASVTAAAPSALLELDRPALDSITRAHPRVRELLEDVYVERATDPAAEAIRQQAGTS